MHPLKTRAADRGRPPFLGICAVFALLLFALTPGRRKEKQTYEKLPWKRLCGRLSTEDKGAQQSTTVQDLREEES